MTDQKGKSATDGTIIHLPKRREPKSATTKVAEEIGLVMAGHFREQNELLRDMNKALSDKVQRLTTGVERLVEEMHGVRTGKKAEAFARIGGADADPDLPTVSGEAALFYTLTAKDIGNQLGFSASQIGTLLSARGLGWAGNGDYQEIGRHKKGMTKFWHRDLLAKLRLVLDQGQPDAFGIKDKAVLAIFRAWETRKQEQALLDDLSTTAPPN